MPEPFEPRTDPDVDLRVPADRRELTARPATVLAAIAAGGVLGALARAGLQHAVPHPSTGFPWATFTINTSGCLLIGVLMAVLGHLDGGPPLTRPFLGVGVLGGFTTFSTYAVDVQQAIVVGAPGTALAYLAATVVGALVAVAVGDAVTAGLLRRATR
ncbi:putative fluoride ion transporter CrcB [Micromonospora saelicesensis]|uniref:Fluoride-specific ion channel FluC n=1 Tax=Micromonospora saelicesensis TaxID=285676 RepID=A0ABX9CB14_9ACTN|nr:MULTISPECIES: CrcB family protein [Micromonospora]RAN93107.1 putative fluoride ion transporter CrcB [Micromonospora saelicesensis]RAO46352.1 putative fluoride ion transporter CrcB [Micromonospora saelicesensis]RAO53099.1 putative fluoride ion transporter CrcB [Micromonospora noduli]RAO56567.1 putative fluoride ion transporter CrcB [Micromonospora saelicesensis]